MWGFRQREFEDALAAGHTLAWKGLWERAVAAYRRAVDLAPREPGARVYLAMALSHVGVEAEALDNIRVALAVQPENGFLMGKVAELQLLCGHREEAGATYSAAGDLLWGRGLYMEAAKQWQHAIEATPDDEGVRVRLVKAYEQVGDFARAAVERQALEQLLADRAAVAATPPPEPVQPDTAPPTDEGEVAERELPPLEPEAAESTEVEPALPAGGQPEAVVAEPETVDEEAAVAAAVHLAEPLPPAAQPVALEPSTTDSTTTLEQPGIPAPPAAAEGELAAAGEAAAVETPAATPEEPTADEQAVLEPVAAEPGPLEVVELAATTAPPVAEAEPLEAPAEPVEAPAYEAVAPLPESPVSAEAETPPQPESRVEDEEEVLSEAFEAASEPEPFADGTAEPTATEVTPPAGDEVPVEPLPEPPGLPIFAEPGPAAETVPVAATQGVEPEFAGPESALVEEPVPAAAEEAAAEVAPEPFVAEAPTEPSEVEGPVAEVPDLAAAAAQPWPEEEPAEDLSAAVLAPGEREDVPAELLEPVAFEPERPRLREAVESEAGETAEPAAVDLAAVELAEVSETEEQTSVGVPGIGDDVIFAEPDVMSVAEHAAEHGAEETGLPAYEVDELSVAAEESAAPADEELPTVAETTAFVVQQPITEAAAAPTDSTTESPEPAPEPAIAAEEVPPESEEHRPAFELEEPPALAEPFTGVPESQEHAAWWQNVFRGLRRAPVEPSSELEETAPSPVADEVAGLPPAVSPDLAAEAAVTEVGTGPEQAVEAPLLAESGAGAPAAEAAEPTAAAASLAPEETSAPEVEEEAEQPAQLAEVQAKPPWLREWEAGLAEIAAGHALAGIDRQAAAVRLLLAEDAEGTDGRAARLQQMPGVDEYAAHELLLRPAAEVESLLLALGRGRAFFEQGMRVAAIREYEAAIISAPDFLPAQIGLAKSLEQMGRTAEACEKYSALAWVCELRGQDEMAMQLRELSRVK